MTDTKLSLLDRIKAAMDSYDICETNEGLYVVADDSGKPLAKFTTLTAAAAHGADLTARAVIDAIVGALKWRALEEHSECYFGPAFVGHVEHLLEGWSGASAKGNWIDGDFDTESEARSAVEAAFRAALTGRRGDA